MTEGLPSEVNSIPVTYVKEAGYENLVVDCPWCRCESVFNRASDLHTFEHIGGLDTQCLNEKCEKPFRIVSDSVNERHEKLIFDCYYLLKRKQYMHCILNLAKAHEMFFSLFLRVELLYKPFAADFSAYGLAEVNRLSEKLEERVSGYTFAPLRRLFLQQLTIRPSPANLDEAQKAIHALPEQAKCVMGVSNKVIREEADASLKCLLIDLNRSKINELRNRVVHKRGYRPTLEETEEALDKTRSVVFPLTSRLDIRDDLNWYMRRK